MNSEIYDNNADLGCIIQNMGNCFIDDSIINNNSADYYIINNLNSQVLTKYYVYNRGVYNVTITPQSNGYATLESDNIAIATYGVLSSGYIKSTTVKFSQTIDTNKYPYLCITLKKTSSNYTLQSNTNEPPSLSINGKTILIDEGTVKISTASITTSQILIIAVGVNANIYEIYLSNM